MTADRTIPTRKGTLAFLRCGMCSQALCRVLDQAYEHPLELEEKASGPLAGGIMQRGYQCGQVWGSALAAGAQAYRLLGSGAEAEGAAIRAAQRIVESFSARYGSIDCSTITGLDWTKTSMGEALRYLAGNGFRCFRMAGQYAPVAFGEIDAALAEDAPSAGDASSAGTAAPAKAQTGSPAPPVSCAAEVVRKMGASDQHAVMAAGLAGGVGLSGGGCGALAAAIWLTDLNARAAGRRPVGFKSPNNIALMERFAAHTESRFLCSEIVGRRFDDVDDHAAFLHSGGCAELVDALATPEDGSASRSPHRSETA